MSDLFCDAVIWLGPGHQSEARCELSSPHEQHFAHHPRTFAHLYWHGQKGFTTAFDESPEDDES